MRRKDREITDQKRIDEMIASCHCCRLGFYDEGSVYIVPLNFGYAADEGKGTIYFHSAKEGRKVGLITKNPNVGFEMDTNFELIESDTPCDYSARYQSIIGNGKVKIIDDKNEKIGALRAIMGHNTGKENWEFVDAMLETVCVFKLEIDEISCKEHL